ncbi:hypothetical protein [Demequina capsici]|uniref:Uncharacterized protein n=1 Tax=Demequina capsici TaxID=3075620 RepID=A0AA96F815_9MICO|nr:hypothetical protein [Demequina sp. OYTSA14]WNM25117.1 hypothetical protein RN606_02930 [Demequina sp. OYTSA14]
MSEGDGAESDQEPMRHREPDQAADGWVPSAIPRRGIEWRSEFLPPDPVVTQAENATFVPARSPRRRVVALLVTVLALLWIGDAVRDVILFTQDAGDDPARVLGVVGVVPVGFRMLVGGVATWFAWRWAGRPVVP